MAVAPSPQYANWTRDGQYFFATNNNQADATATLFSGVVSPDSDVLAHLSLGWDWTGASSGAATYAYHVYIAESRTEVDAGTATAVMRGGWAGASVVDPGSGNESLVNVSILIPQGFYLRIDAIGEAGVTPRTLLMVGRKV